MRGLNIDVACRDQERIRKEEKIPEAMTRLEHKTKHLQSHGSQKLRINFITNIWLLGGEEPWLSTSVYVWYRTCLKLMHIP